MELPGEESNWAEIGKLGRARGLRGELIGRANYEASRYGWVKTVYLRRRDGSLVGDGAAFELASIRDYKDGLIYQFRGVDTRSAAEELEHCVVLVAESERPAPESGFYVSDLIGAEVVELKSGRLVGTVESWQEFGGPEVLEVRPPDGGELIWIPLAKEICVEIDAAGKRVVVDPPEGLLDLNESAKTG